MRLERLTACAVVLLLAAAAPPAAARWYQVEVVVFRQSSALGNGGERWPPLADLPDFRNAVRLVETLPELGDEPDGAGGPVAFAPVARGERRLAGVARRLDGGGYETLLASAWRQPGFGVARARRVYLADIEAPGPVGTHGAGTPEAEGTVSIKVGRLLHVAVDFLYDHDGTPVRLRETRRVKLREIHYFDHPLFGVVVQVSPYTLPEPPAAGAVAPPTPIGAG